MSAAKEKADAASKKEASILKEKASLETRIADESKLAQSLKEQVEKLAKKANAKEEMLSKESELMTLQSNLDL